LILIIFFWNNSWLTDEYYDCKLIGRKKGIMGILEGKGAKHQMLSCRRVFSSNPKNKGE